MQMIAFAHPSPGLRRARFVWSVNSVRNIQLLIDWGSHPIGHTSDLSRTKFFSSWYQQVISRKLYPTLYMKTKCLPRIHLVQPLITTGQELTDLNLNFLGSYL